MGRKREPQKPAGIEEHHGRIRLDFRFNGARCREPLDLDWSPRNVIVAERLRAEISEKIRLGTFNYADYFPESPRAKALGSRRRNPPFSEVADDYLDSLEVAHSTKREYKKALNCYWTPVLGTEPINSIGYGRLKGVVAGTPWPSNKTRNNALVSLRGVFAYAVRDKLITENPALEIENRKHQTREPDPLTLAEIDAFLSACKEETERNLFEVAFFSGMRTSELIGLWWSDVDWLSGIARVQRAFVRGKLKATKTEKARNVELTSRALAALKRQRAFTEAAGAEVFRNPRTGQPWQGDQDLRRRWKVYLRGAKLRAREAYQTRHTFATLAIMAGANPVWVSRQLGHSDPMFTFRVYARWIDGADKSRELGRLDAAIAGDGSACSDSPASAKP